LTQPTKINKKFRQGCHFHRFYLMYI